ncbi:MAG: glycosyltransferase family 39 protein [Candidatus Promineifilaceae bacterium]|nr:glycosyltransferase family 39 protein [Candidatus Promineifilaceae bacterium]
MDEQNHITRGLAFLRTADPRLSVEHPPLVNSLSAMPLLTLPQITLPFEDPSWERQPLDVFWYVFAEKTIWELNRHLDLGQIFFLARMPIVYLTLGLALVGWHFAREMWGRLSGTLVFLLLLFDPNILANGRYSTTDIGGTLFGLLATFLLWRLWRSARWNWRRWIWAALGIGFAFGGKLSTLLLVPIWTLLAILPVYKSANRPYLRSIVRRLVQLFTAGIGALMILWVIYGFEWGGFHFLDDRMSFMSDFAGPMPTYWAGIERIMLLSSGGRPGFLLGQFSNEGFPLFFPVAFVVKTPMLTIVLFLLSFLILLINKKSREKEIFLLIPAIIYFGASVISALNLGYRHLLPILPFIYLSIGGLASPPVRVWTWQHFSRNENGTGRESLAPVVLVSLLVVNLILIAFWIHPHYLSYFNIVAGGPENGRNILIDSNIDWGQDLQRLDSWMQKQGIEKVKLGWFGTADPAYYEIEFDPLPGFPRQAFNSQWTNPPFSTIMPEPGIYAISVSSLWELPLSTKNVYTWFREQEPDYQIGYSILIYEIP